MASVRCRPEQSIEVQPSIEMNSGEEERRIKRSSSLTDISGRNKQLTEVEANEVRSDAGSR